MLEIKKLFKRLGDFEIRDLSLTIKQADYFVLLGESGAGKTVLLEMISGLLLPDSGTIEMNYENITKKAIQKRGIGLVYQDYALFPHMSVWKNIAYPLKKFRLNRESLNLEVEHLAKLTGASELLERRPTTLSLGEKQRVALARTLGMQPDILLLDEPLASLDVQSKSEIRSILRRLNKAGQTIIHVTHDYHEAIALADKIAIIENNGIVQQGTPKEIFQHPKSKFIANLVGIKNFFKGYFTQTEEGVGVFETEHLRLDVASKAQDGAACLILGSEEITISNTSHDSSARNHFPGKVIDIEPAHLGVEVSIDIGEPIVALITQSSLDKMKIEIGTSIWIDFKASATKLIKE